jgi:hypothetical protein
MTTITIEQSLLEQALNALLLPCDRWNKQQFLIVKGAIESLNAALVAPATAPAWHVAPTVPGLWLNSVFMKVEDVEQWHIDCQLHLECARWFGPIPPDGDKP